MTSDDRIKVTTEFSVSDLIAAGSLTFTITPNRPDPEPEELPPTRAEPQGGDQ